jgi:hypothetical protein
MAANVTASVTLNSLQDMAGRIYIQMLTDAVVIANNNATISVNPEALAKISFRLAEDFFKVADGVHEGTKPANKTLDLDKVDFGLHK